jgi:hypothetical protein
VTALCGGGPSGPKPGVAELIAISAPMIGSKLNNMGGLWATLAVGALGLLTYEASELCTTDPPPQPTITAAEYQALLELGPAELFTSALGKLKDLVTIALWFDLCACTSVTTPPPPTNLLQPPAGTTLPDYVSTPCPSPRYRAYWRGAYFIRDDTTNVTETLFPNLEYTVSVATDANHPSTHIAAIPQTWVSLDSFIQLVSGNAPGTDNYSVEFVTYGASKQAIFAINQAAVNNANPTRRDPVSGSTAFDRNRDFYFSVHTVAGGNVAGPGTADYQLNIHCSGQSIAPISCGADPILMAMLSQLIETCNQIRSDVTLVQRYALPFAYVRGPSISGLTGAGSMALGRSVGLLIDVLGFPAANKQMLGEPPYIFDLGWVSALTPDGLVDEIRLTREHTTWLSKLIPSADLVGWGLRDGVQIRITELHAEP